MADHNNNDSDFEVDNEFIEDDSWPEEADATTAPPKKKKSGGMIVLIGGLIIIGAGAYYAKDILMPSADIPATPATETAQMNSNPYAQDYDTGADMATNAGSGNDSQMAPRPEDSPQAAMPGSMPDEDMDIFGESSGSSANFPEDSDFPSDTDSDFDTGEANPADISFGGNDQDMPPETAEFDQAAPDMPAVETEPMNSGAEDSPDMPENDFAFGGNNIEESPEDSFPSDDQSQERETTTTSPAPDEETVVANEEIEALNARIETLEDELKTLQSLLDNQNTSQLEKQVAKLNQKISTLEADPPQKSAESSSRKTAPAPKPKAQTSAAQQDSAPDWVLRSANSESAWVSVDGNNDMQKVTVGDTLEGLGEVRSIEFDRYQGWVVTGSESKLTQ